MQDRFKFRVWAKPHEPTKTDGYYVDDADYMVMLPNGEVEIEYYCDDGYAGYIQSFKQDEIIVEQCTGQKDKNGNLIYENDIIYDRFDDCYKSVYWDNEDACWALQWENICGEPLKEGADFELFGNIHENADLLEGKE